MRETLLNTVPGIVAPTDADVEEVCRAVRCPVLVVHGERDEIVPYAIGARVAEWTGGTLVTVPDGGHAMPMRDPVRFTLLVREFVESLAGPATRSRSWTPARSRRRRALFVSSAIGLGHALRDVAIADELRALHPDLEIDWLAQHPVTRLLADRGERVHPASRFLASESAHIESEAGEHDLHAFQAIRRMDEILAANFHVFHDVVEDEQHDLVVADEGWDIDHFLHENPELKRTAYAWLTDFVGWLPMADGGPREADADGGLQRRDGRADRPLPAAARPFDLRRRPRRPGDRPRWARGCRPCVTGPGPTTPSPATSPGSTARATAPWCGPSWASRPDEPVCVVAVGGSGVGGPLLRRVVAAHPYAAKRVPGLRMVVVTGPRIDPATVPAAGGRRGARLRARPATGCSPPATSRSSTAG